jgi:hypothetical protein
LRLAATAASLGATSIVSDIGSTRTATATFLTETSAMMSTLIAPGLRTATINLLPDVGGSLGLTPVLVAGPTAPEAILGRDERENTGGAAEATPAAGNEGNPKRLNRAVLEVDPPPQSSMAPPEPDDASADEQASSTTEVDDPMVADVVFASGWPLLDVAGSTEVTPD